jgi:hypothetical protein
LFMHEAEAPAAIVVDHHEKKDAAGVSGAGCTVRERPGLVVGVGPTLPVADTDRAVGPTRLGIRIGKHRTQQNGERSSTAFHKYFPHIPKASIFIYATRVYFGLTWRAKISSPWRRELHATGSCSRQRQRSELPMPTFVEFFAGSFRLHMDLVHGGGDFEPAGPAASVAVVLLLRPGVSASPRVREGHTSAPFGWPLPQPCRNERRDQTPRCLPGSGRSF